MIGPFVIDFRKVRTVDQLARSLGILPQLLMEVAESPNRETFYHRFEIPKKSPRKAGEHRIVWAVTSPSLADAHKNFARRFNDFVVDVVNDFPHPCAHGYVPKRSTLTNATEHCGAPVLLRADIRSFFSSIKRGRLNALFSQLKLNESIVPTLSAFVTIRDELPLGLHGSPLLANLACMDLDHKLKALAEGYGCIYTRYADDLAFSGSAGLPSRFELSDVLSGEGFELSPNKFRITKQGQAHFVTGLSVSDPKRPHVPKRLKRRLRQELFYCDKYGIEDHLKRGRDDSVVTGVNRIDGMLRYLHGIEPELGHRLRQDWKRILTRDSQQPTYSPMHERAPRKVFFFIDETEINSEDGTVLAIACVAIEAEHEFSVALESLRDDHIADAFSSGRKKKVEKKGLHFADLHEEVRDDLIRLLAEMPFRAFVAYDLLSNHSTYQDAYESLLCNLLRNRMIKYDRCILKIIWEQNSKLTPARIDSVVSDTYRDMENRNSRRPLSLPDVKAGEKLAEPYLSVPDALLGVFSHYAMLETLDQTGTSRKGFERLRDKYRLIVSFPTRTYFTRHQPFQPWPEGQPIKL